MRELQHRLKAEKNYGYGYELASLTMRELQHRLKAEKNHGRWSVVDAAGGVWHPNEDVQGYLEVSFNPAKMVVYICVEDDHLGTWHA